MKARNLLYQLEIHMWKFKYQPQLTQCL